MDSSFLNGWQLAGFIGILLLFVGLGVGATRMVRSSSDFAVGGRRAGWPLVAGAIVGTLVSGSSTLGTAQLAYTSGLDSWWVTLGAGIAALLLGLLAPRLHSRTLQTVPQLLGQVYGPSIVPLTSAFSSLAIFLSMVGNGLAGIALLTSLLPMSPLLAGVLCVALVLAFVLTGGMYGAGLLGQLKLILLLLALGGAGILAYTLAAGWSGLQTSLGAGSWSSLFGRGIGKDLAIGLSLVVGVLSTQTYVQALFAASNWRAARTGAVVAALATPVLGLGGVLVGLFMRASNPGLPSATVLPVFLLRYFPPLLGGMATAVLLVTVVSGWAGLALGVATMLGQDFLRHLLRPRLLDKTLLLAERFVLLVICGLTLWVILISKDSLIVDWYVLSLSLRGATILFPLLGVLFLPGWISPRSGIAAALLGPLVVMLFYFLGPAGVDPLYPGLAASALVLLTGTLRQRRWNRPRLQPSPPLVSQPIHEEDSVDKVRKKL